MWILNPICLIRGEEMTQEAFEEIQLEQFKELLNNLEKDKDRFLRIAKELQKELGESVNSYAITKLALIRLTLEQYSPPHGQYFKKFKEILKIFLS
mgnify:CR=1 FL=1